MSASRKLLVVGGLAVLVLSVPLTARNGTGRVLDGPVTIRSPTGPALCLQSTAVPGAPVIGFEVKVEQPGLFVATSGDVTGGVVTVASDPRDFGPAKAVGLDVYADAFNGDEPGTAYGVRAYALGSDCSEAVGVEGQGSSDISVGLVYCGIGVRGKALYSGSFAYGVFSDGDFAATGSKSFLQPHPTDPSRAIRFSALEGNESGTYFRGTAELVGGRAEVSIPESWRLATEEDGITVQLTPMGANLGLYVVEQSRERIVVGGERDGTFHFLVNGVRRGFAEHEDVIENRFFRPQIRGVPFGTQYPEALREVLVQNGILNADGTPNEDTARKLGWELVDPDSVPARERWWLSAAERRSLMAAGE